MTMLDTAAHVVSAADTRRTETPNAVMTTLASPETAETAALSLWRVELAAGASGPVHTMDSEQIWTVDAGSGACTVGEVRHDLEAGDTIRIAADAERQFTSEAGARFIVCGYAHAIARTKANGDGVVPPWIM